MGLRLRGSWVLCLAACTPAQTEPAPKSDAKALAHEVDKPAVVADTGDAPADATPESATPTPLAEDPPGDDPPDSALPLEKLPDPNAPDEPDVEPAAAAEPVEVPVSEAAPAAKTIAWRTVTTTTEAVSLVPLSRGVLGRGNSGFYDVDANGAFVMRPEINAPNGTIQGRWPTNAWVIEERTKTIPGDRMDEEIRQLRLMRLRGERRWVPQMYEGEQRFVDEGQRFVVGTKGGMLAEDSGDIVRVAGNAGDPERGVGRPGELVAFFETGSGKLYTARRDSEAMYVQRDCEDEACVAENAMKLPIGKFWQFSIGVARAKHSVTLAAKIREGEEDKPFLLHYGAGSWKLERVAATPAGLWGARDGGLWAMLDDALAYRAPDGSWHAVELPDGATAVTAAIRDDLSEMWVAAPSGEATTIYATAVSPLPPAAAETP